MKKILFLTMMGGMVLTSCMNKAEFFSWDEMAKENGESVFGLVDPNQDWSPITSGTITITADADLDNIVKVQVLTESPFFNEDAKVLNEARAQKGQVVTLTYDAPNTCKELVAACVSDKGVYYIQVFNIDESSVSFAKSSKARTRGGSNDIPTFTSIKLSAPHASLNALRAQAGTFKVGNTTYTEWQNSNWENELMWEPADGQTFDNGWHLDTDAKKGHIYRELNGLDEGEKKNIEKILNDFLYKYSNDEYSVNGKKNNLKLIKQSNSFTMNNNYITTNGMGTITLIPIQAYTTEFKMNHIYYYYKDEDIPAGMSEVDYIKSLPKFKAIQVERIETSNESKSGAFLRTKEFLLPYYEGAPQEGENKASAIFPAGYKIGFLNMKHNNGDYSINKSNFGCTYGDGRLNVAVNHLSGHFKSAIDKSLGGNTKEGMQYDDPRIAIFKANNKTYMAFEDGADCNFCDMIIEIGGSIDPSKQEPAPTSDVEKPSKIGGYNAVDDEVEVKGKCYTMCFEDRPISADYDMNDVVLRCYRNSETQITLALVACGGDDDVVIRGANGWKYDGHEVHEILGVGTLSNGHRFINTEEGGRKADVVYATVNIPAGTTIPQYLKNIYIENRTTGNPIKFPKMGEYPYAIIVPEIFKYPMEKQSITAVYSNFLTWTWNAAVSKDWYMENANKVFPELFDEWIQ